MPSFSRKASYVIFLVTFSLRRLRTPPIFGVAPSKYLVEEANEISLRVFLPEFSLCDVRSEFVTCDGFAGVSDFGVMSYDMTSL